MARQGFVSNNNDPYVYQESDTGVSASLGIEDGSSTYKISVSASPNVTPSAFTQIEIEPISGDITIRPNLGTVRLDGFTAITGNLRIDPLNAGVMQTDTNGNVSSTNGTNGQLLIGGGAAPIWANLTSTGGSVTITNGANSINLEASGVGGLTQLDGDTGSALPAGGVITIAGGNLVTTAAAGSTVTVDVTGGTNGQVIVGATAGNPAFATLSSTGGTITYTTGANTLNIDGTPATTTQQGVIELATNAETINGSDTTRAVTPDDLKAKLGTQTNHGVLIGAGQTAVVTSLAVGATNTVLLGNTGADPSFGQVPNAALVSSTITLNNGNNITVTGSPISLGGAATIAVTGTTNHAIQSGNASGSLTSLAVGTNGQVILGATGAAPAFGTLTSSGGTITYITGVNALNIDGTAATTTQAGVLAIATNAETIAGTVTNKAVTPDDVKAKLGTQTNHGILVGAGTTAAVTALAVGATNTVLLGNTGADPSFGTVPNAALTNSSITLTAGNNISVSVSPVSLGGSTTIAVAGTTNHAVQVGNASASLTSLSVGLNGQVLIGATGQNPAFANITSSNGSITLTTGANTLDIITTAAAGVSSVTGTTNQITASPTTGAVVVSTPTTFIAPGTIASTTTNAAGTNFLLPTTSSTAGQLQINGTRFLHAYGTENTFVGTLAGNFTTTSTQATCIGYSAGNALSAGANATYVGAGAGQVDAGGDPNNGNTGIGSLALGAYTGSTGSRNTCVGYNTLGSLTTGQRNIALGWHAGNNLTTNDSDNIYIGYLQDGVASQNNKIRIGNGTGTGAGQANDTRIFGIRGITTGSATAIAVLIDTNGQLGTVSSSIRFKDNVLDMRHESSPILSLRPVTFEYKAHPGIKQYGLIAEEVLETFPELVVFDNEGQVESVKYHDLPILLLNEVKRLSQELKELKESLHGK